MLIGAEVLQDLFLRQQLHQLPQDSEKGRVLERPNKADLGGTCFIWSCEVQDLFTSS